jgi:hypothetical protein
MSAICFSCSYGLSAIEGTSATGDPVGICRRCGVFDCDGHGQRDPNGPAFIGAECDPTILVASVAKDWQGAADSVVGRHLQGLATRFPSGMLVSSIGNFLDRRPKYHDWLLDRIENQRTSVSNFFASEYSRAEAKELWTSSSDSGRELLLAAVVLIESLSIPDELLDNFTRIARPEIA